MPRSSNTHQHIDDHLGQAEFELKVASNFECLKGTPAHDAVRVALARVADARTWTRQQLSPVRLASSRFKPVIITPVEQHRNVLRRMARLAP